jgi:hypothetical protein
MTYRGYVAMLDSRRDAARERPRDRRKLRRAI